MQSSSLLCYFFYSFVNCWTCSKTFFLCREKWETFFSITAFAFLSHMSFWVFVVNLDCQSFREVNLSEKIYRLLPHAKTKRKQVCRLRTCFIKKLRLIKIFSQTMRSNSVCLLTLWTFNKWFIHHSCVAYNLLQLSCSFLQCASNNKTCHCFLSTYTRLYSHHHQNRVYFTTLFLLLHPNVNVFNVLCREISGFAFWWN